MQPHQTRIMIVEDDEQDCAFIAEVLSQHGYQAIIVNESQRAVAVAEATVPHAFLLDLVMPPPDGFQLCRMLRQHPQFRRTPILIVTALDQTDSKIVAIGAGADNYLVKPFGPDELLAKLRAILKLSG